MGERCETANMRPPDNIENEEHHCENDVLNENRRGTD